MVIIRCILLIDILVGGSFPLCPHGHDVTSLIVNPDCSIPNPNTKDITARRL
jgi:hypothetical protein